MMTRFPRAPRAVCRSGGDRMVLRQRARLLWSGKVDTTRYELDITFAVHPVRAWQLSFERVEDRELRLLSLVAGTARRPAVDARWWCRHERRRAAWTGAGFVVFVVGR